MTRFRRIFLFFLLFALVALGAAEIFLRGRFQLGDPPLTILHPTIAYLFKPDSEYHRFGNRIAFNAYSQRSDAFPKIKSRAGEQRIFFLGDSVINGGNQIDQSAIASELVRVALRTEGRDITVANASAKSWSVFNQHAYLKEFGFFDADVLVLVSNYTDFTDTPAVRVPPIQDHPRRKPFLALEDFAINYLPRFLPSWFPCTPSPEPEVTLAQQVSIQARCEVELTALLEEIKGSVPHVFIYYTVNKDELTKGNSPAIEGFARVASSQGVPFYTSLATYRASEARGIKVLSDRVHPTVQGQALLAADILPLIRPLLPSASVVTRVE